MNQIALVSVITSCIWAALLLYALMYWRLKKMIDMTNDRINQEHDEVYRSIDEKIKDVHMDLERTDKELHDADQELSRYIDSRIDKMLNKQNKD